MRLLKSILLLATFIFCSLLAQAQRRTVKLSFEPDSFMVDMNNLMKRNRNVETAPVVEEFEPAFSSMNDRNKKRFITIARHIVEQRMPLYPNMDFLLKAFTAASAKGLNEDQSSRLLFATWRTAVYKPKQFSTYLSRVTNFLNEGIIANGNVKVISENQTFRFDYYLGETEADTGAFKGMEAIANLGLPEPKLPNQSDGENNLPELDPLNFPEGPLLFLTDVADWKITTTFDSTTLAKASGAINLTENLARVNAGEMDWTMTGLTHDDMYCTLGTFSWNLKTSYFKCEAARLTMPGREKFPIWGIFEFHSTRHRSPEDSEYPRFQSYLKNNQFFELGEGIDIVGGITQKGRVLSTANYFNSYSVFSFKPGGKKAFQLLSPEFQISDSLVNSNYSLVQIFNKNDTLYHPGVVLDYQVNKRLLRMSTEVKSLKETPFFDTYHKFEITCDDIYYYLDSNKVEFRIRNAPALVPAVFQSTDYYNADIIKALKGYKNYDPLVLMLAMEKKMESPTFSILDVTGNYPTIRKNDIEYTARLLASFYFIDYEPLRGKITIRPKLRHYYNSRLKRKDFDFMSLQSFAPNGVNASYNLTTQDMKIFAVTKFFLSDSLNVFIEPTNANKDISVKKGRSIKFDGKLNAGAFLITGKNFELDYDKFNVKLVQIDSIALNVDKKGDTASQKKLNELQSAYNKSVKLESKRHGDTSKKELTTGTLFINDPINKSGKKRIEKYPILDVSSPAYVYFDNPGVKGNFNENVYFDVPPFNIDSAGQYDPKTVKFKGKFHSDGIFPVFEDTLQVQKDKSMGFTHKVPPEGYKLFEGKAIFNGTLAMNKQGLRGKGEIVYLGTVIRSNNFRFYQDSVTADGKSFTMKSGNRDNISFPDAKIDNYRLQWHPKQDSMVLTSKEKDFKLYKGLINLQGNLTLSSKKGVGGAGSVRSKGVKVTSNLLSFTEKEYSGRESNFIIESSDTANPAVRSTNVKFEYSLKRKSAEISPEVEGVASNEFPLMKYKTSIGKLVWNSEKKTVQMEKPAEEEIENSYFYSTDPQQDSLNFLATNATYDIAQNTLNVKGVPNIKVADALIIPDSGNVTIASNAKIVPLKNARLTLDTLNEYHQMSGATVQILGRYVFKGSADYNYAGPNGDTLKVNFNDFSQVYPRNKRGDLDKTKGVTEGSGIVGEEKPLFVNAGVAFKGGVKMVANKKLLEFDGFVGLATKLGKISTWIPYKNIDGGEFSIDITKAKDAFDNPLKNGIFLQPGEEYELYSVIAGPTRSPVDQAIFTTTGTVMFDASNGVFKIGKPERMEGKVLEGDLMYYNDSLGKQQFEGTFYPYIAPSGSKGKFKTYFTGYASNTVDPTGEGFNGNFMLQLMPPIAPDAIKALETASLAAVANAGYDAAAEDTESLPMKIANSIGNAAGRTYQKASATQFAPIAKIVPQLASGFLFSEIKLKWSAKHKAFYSDGPLGLSNINKSEINSKIDGALEIKKTPAGDILNLYLEYSADEWYMFSMGLNNRLSITSSDDVFNEVINAKQMLLNENSFSFGPGEPTDKGAFLKEFYKNYFDKEYKEGASIPKAKSEDGTPNSDDLFGEGKTEEAPKKNKKSSKKDEEKKPETKEGEEAAPTNSEEPATPAETPKETKKSKKEKKAKKKKDDAAADSLATDEGTPELETTPKTEEPAVDPFGEEPKKEEPKKETPKKEEPVPAVKPTDSTTIKPIKPSPAVDSSAAKPSTGVSEAEKEADKKKKEEEKAAKEAAKAAEKEAEKKKKEEEKAAKEAAKEAERKRKEEEKAAKEAEKEAERKRKEEEKAAKKKAEEEEKQQDQKAPPADSTGGGGGF